MARERHSCFFVPQDKSAGYGIELIQLSLRRFEVRYGSQVDTRLTYGEAASKLGSAIMHAAALMGNLDPDA